MQVMDIKPEPKTELEIHNRWKQHFTAILYSNSLNRKKIKVVCHG